MEQKNHLRKVFPELRNLIDKASPIKRLQQKRIPVAEAVTKIVVGQMLSGAATKSIYSRLIETRDKRGLDGCWQLSKRDLLKCGLSRGKTRTIQEFGKCYDSDMGSIEAWRKLDYIELNKVVCSHWGLSRWSVDILAISYFANPDVFPATDGTIVRVREILDRKYLRKPLNPELAKPFRTYLALYMWAFMDEGLIDPKI